MFTMVTDDVCLLFRIRKLFIILEKLILNLS